MSDEAASFLASIAELKQRREQQDMERIQALEEDIRRRRAFREERARSISPDKPAQANNFDDAAALRSPSNALGSSPSMPPTMDKPTAPEAPPSPTKDIPEFTGFKSVRSSTSSANANTAQTPDRDSHASPPPSASSLARRGTLSWQQRRPESRGGSRPTSSMGPDASAGAAHAQTEQREPSREDIRASLSKRDPSWFRQTADRGTGSAAYRRSQDDESGKHQSFSSRRGLPGMQPESSQDIEKPDAPSEQESARSGPTSRSTSVRGSGTSSHRFSASTSTSTNSKPDLKSLIEQDAGQQEAYPVSDTSSTAESQTSSGRTMTMSNSQARLGSTAERPGSPTKGMGGFVQSAIMKRSDSVNKRWSAQPSGNLSRQNSMASARGGQGGLQGSYSMPKLEPTPGSRESSHEPSSRPTSSSSNLTNLTMTQGGEKDDTFTRPTMSRHGRSKSVFSSYSATGEDGATSPPGSPSKRFSPTKSSWIESALTRPESPKPSAAKNAQPSWMANIAKAKADRASADSTPRPGTPKKDEGESSRPGSPTKAPFGQGMLKRSDSRDLGLPVRSSTPPFMKEQPQTPAQKPPTLQSDGPSQEADPPLKEDPVLEEQAEKSEVAEPTQQAPSEPEKDTKPVDEARPSTDLTTDRAEPIKSPPIPTSTKPKPEIAPKPETAPKPMTDFRSTLRSRPPPEPKKQETPEFLSKFGSLRKAQTEKYVAPDTFRANIERGKADLNKTDGPVKTPRRDELRESLLAKKDDWQKAKEEGRELPGALHERKASANAPALPSKPEGLARRDMLNRSESNRSIPGLERGREATPEALARHKSLKDRPKVEPPTTKQVGEPTPSPAPSQEPSTIEPLARQTSEPSKIEEPQRASETSKLAARFNPGLANILARGPPAMNNSSNPPSRTASPVVPDQSSSAASPAGEPKAGEPLQDMRKGRAKGPKKSKRGAANTEVSKARQEAVSSLDEPQSQQKPETATESPAEAPAPAPEQTQKPRAPPGSTASIMMASLRGSNQPQEMSKGSEKPVTPAKSPSLSMKSAESPKEPAKDSVPEFAGFGSIKNKAPMPLPDDNKENNDESRPSAKSAAAFWNRQASPKRSEAPPQIQLPSQKDEEAAMRSAGLLASSPARTGGSSGSGDGNSLSVQKSNGQASTPPASTGAPPKPTKSSRIVSGQLGEASLNRGVVDSVAEPTTEAEGLLAKAFGSIPTATKNCTLDVAATISDSRTEATGDVKTIRKSVQEVAHDGTLANLRPREEYTLYDEAVYVCVYSIVNAKSKVSTVYVWQGASAIAPAKDQGQTVAKRLAREHSAQVHVVQQGQEPMGLIQALGGILVTRRGASETAPKQYMLCGRKHIGNIAFDEVDYSVQSFCPGFVYLISFPVTLQETKLYLWKGLSCSTDEISAARLAAMDLSETGEIIEVDNGAEFASFLKIFGRGTMKLNIPKQSELMKKKASAPEKFEAKLFKVQQPEQKGGLFAMFTRRPSWNSSVSRSPSRDGQEIKVEVKHISPFTQADMEAEGIYILDATHHLYVLIGPLFASQQEATRNAVLGQALLFAQEYIAAVEAERQVKQEGFVLFNGVPQDLKVLFRHWDDSKGLWGTAGLMAGSSPYSGNELKLLPLEEVVGAVCRE
ncbi:hypothetical protein D0863_08405 [Hortaea werneckii]|uniref:Uncharacterized protein n=1 Tax=Hortaea werneckii TaxID=91943 RepID=A0A3M7DQ03_HORWE|nr:hypothetical protein D0863_08405 [Hortaea werneckii]